MWVECLFGTRAMKLRGGWRIARRGIGVAQRRLYDKIAIEGGAKASMVIAGREPANQTGIL
jgi:hypothetical protein